MTTLTTSWFTEPTGTFGSALRAVATTVRGIRDGVTVRNRYEELSRLSDSELAERGIRREEIARLVLTGHYL